MEKSNYYCYGCKEEVANGVGPSGLPTVTTILNKLPSSSIFYDDACQHDKDYHDQIGKKLADDFFLQSMKKSVKSQPYISRWFWYAQAYRNWWFVDRFGDEAYRDGACRFLTNTKNEN
jgi:hypothetical protein